MTTNGTTLSITTPSMNGYISVSKRCSLVAPARWAFAVIADLLLNAHIHASFVKPVNPKPAVPVASKAPSSGLPSSVIFCQTANGNTSPTTMPHLLWPFFNNNWSLLNQLFRCATRAMLKHAKCLGLEIGIFCALHTYGRQLNQHPHIHLSVTRGERHMETHFFQKERRRKSLASAIIRLLRDNYFQLQPNTLPGFGHIRDYPLLLAV